MKFKLIITTIIISIASLGLKAETPSNFTVTGSDNHSFTLQISNVKTSAIQVSFKDSKGYTLYDETVSQTSLNHMKFNINDIPSGNYSLIVAYDNIIKIQPITKTYNSIKIKTLESQTIYVPVFRQHAEYLDVSMLCLTKQKYTLSIIDNEGNIIFNDITDPSIELQKRFNLSSLEKGDYTFSIGINNKVIYKEFNKTITWQPIMPSI